MSIYGLEHFTWERGTFPKLPDKVDSKFKCPDETHQSGMHIALFTEQYEDDGEDVQYSYFVTRCIDCNVGKPRQVLRILVDGEIVEEKEHLVV